MTRQHYNLIRILAILKVITTQQFVDAQTLHGVSFDQPFAGSLDPSLHYEELLKWAGSFDA